MVISVEGLSLVLSKGYDSNSLILFEYNFRARKTALKDPRLKEGHKCN